MVIPSWSSNPLVSPPRRQILVSVACMLTLQFRAGHAIEVLLFEGALVSEGEGCRR